MVLDQLAHILMLRLCGEFQGAQRQSVPFNQDIIITAVRGLMMCVVESYHHHHQHYTRKRESKKAWSERQPNNEQKKNPNETEYTMALGYAQCARHKQ